MSYLSEAQLGSGDAAQELWIKDAIARLFWQWYAEHEDDVIVSKRILFFSLNLRVRDIRFLFETLLGPRPIGV